VRSVAAGIPTAPDWPTGSSSELEATLAKNVAHAAAVSGGSEHQHGNSPPSRYRRARNQAPPAPDAYLAINNLLPAAERLPLAYPVQIVPPVRKDGPWFVRSDSQNRMLRDTYTLDPVSGAVLHREGFAEQAWIDRIVGVGVSYHEGQLFGIFNQAVSLFTAFSAATLAISSVVMWWHRRPVGVFGAPVSLGSPSFAPALVAFGVLLAATFPMLGVSSVCLYVVERFVLRRLPGVRHWLGLQPA
jgi:uncharacterized iron-regulated membrane protein